MGELDAARRRCGRGRRAAQGGRGQGPRDHGQRPVRAGADGGRAHRRVHAAQPPVVLGEGRRLFPTVRAGDDDAGRAHHHDQGRRDRDLSPAYPAPTILVRSSNPRASPSSAPQIFHPDSTTNVAHGDDPDNDVVNRPEHGDELGDQVDRRDDPRHQADQHDTHVERRRPVADQRSRQAQDVWDDADDLPRRAPLVAMPRTGRASRPTARSGSRGSQRGRDHPPG